MDETPKSSCLFASASVFDSANSCFDLVNLMLETLDLSVLSRAKTFEITQLSLQCNQPAH